MFWCHIELTLYTLLHILLIIEASKKSHSDWLFPSLGARIYSSEKRGTYFGYSVASYVGQSQSFCLVGAPKGVNTYDFLGPEPTDNPSYQDSLTSMFENTTGLIYRLDLDFEYPDCSRMPIADNNEDRRLYGTKEPGRMF
ncbi:unnamed protein product [Rodentolepis nana]|uniref:Secreted protein n=1 Tax=Rodentolepis nana TaxID=102285 RepID=A0A0R3TBN4_RODNA|nr:unnamed protein product [Rodentolepis nana]